MLLRPLMWSLTLTISFALCNVLAQSDETVNFETRITDLVDNYWKEDIDRLVSPSDREQFYNFYYENYGLLDNLDINSLLGILGQSQASKESCETCNKLMGLGKLFLKTPEAITTLIGSICKDSASLSKRTCLGLVNLLAEPLAWLFSNSPLVSQEICSVLAGQRCLKYLSYPHNETIFWELPLPEKLNFTPKASQKKIRKILHLTDIHLDLWYEPNSNASCNEPLCCRVTSEDWKLKNVSAGYWSEVNGDCDIPQHFVADSLKKIVAAHPDLDAVFWTGDNVPHDVWNTTQPINLRHIHTVTGMISVAFNNIPVFPVLGNHEVHPINMYIPDSVSKKAPNFNNSWLYDTLVDDYWARWLDTDDIRKTFRRGGFYSKKVTPEWKVVVLNSNMPQKGNFWILFDPLDPDGQLKWLIDELDSAEKSGSYVTILGHVPPKHEMYDAWVHNYIRIIDRYSHIITSSFFGHTHDDEVVVLYNLEKKPVSVAYISGSLTTYSYLNPQYSIFKLDQTGLPVDSKVYLTDMDSDNIAFNANHSTSPVWQFEYSPKESYRMKNMTANSWDNFVKQAETSLDLAFLYLGHYHRYSKEFTPLSIPEVKRLIRDIRRYSPFLELDGNE